MKLFRVQEARPFTHQFDGEYSWLLPAVRCTTCGRYDASSLGCPELDIRGKLDESLYRSGPPVSQEGFEELVAPLRRIVTGGWPLLPGMGFGPLVGRVFKRERRDFLWLFARTVMIRESAFEGLLREGIRIKSGPARIRNPRGSDLRPDYVRVAQLMPIPCMGMETLAYAEHQDCPGCGLRVRQWPRRLFLRARLVPGGLDIFSLGVEGRVHPFENIIVTERFEQAARLLQLTNISFEEVDLVD